MEKVAPGPRSMSKNWRAQDENIGFYRSRKMLEMVVLREGQCQEAIFLREIIGGPP